MANSDEIDLVAVWRVLYARKYLIAISAGLCGILAAVWALTATPIYRAQVVVSEAQATGGGSVAALANQFGGLANLMGVNMGAGGSSQNAKAILKSRYAVEEFLKRHGPVSKLFGNAKKPLTLWLAVDKFRDGVLMIREDQRTGVITVLVDWSDPAIAAAWANDFVAVVNELIRTRALDEAKRNIAYLNDQIAHTNVVELQRVMYGLIENETKTLMLANAKSEYAFAIIDPAVPPEIRISPRRTVIVLLGTAFGLFAGALAAFVHHKSAQRKGSGASVVG